ncbi:MAG: cbb3-type cytochrome oxidase assembly protein CcoS [Pseudomonadota bacterium]
MSILLVMIPLSIALLATAVGIFFWAVRRGQFDDLETPAWRVVLDDDSRPPQTIDGGEDR